MKEVFNGVSAELLAAIIMYPLNTLKTNSQIGKTIIKPNIKNLSRGIGWCIITELINAVVFYSIFENIKQKKGALFGSILGSSAAISLSYPLNVRRKLLQVGKPIQIKNNYKGFFVGLFNGVPGTSINFTLRENFIEKCENKKLKPLCGLISTAISVVVTHPLDTISTCIATRSPFKMNYILNGFKERFFEKNLTIGTKMLVLGYLNK
jgi:hypothetical protein